MFEEEIPLSQHDQLAMVTASFRHPFSIGKRIQLADSEHEFVRKRCLGFPVGGG